MFCIYKPKISCQRSWCCLYISVTTLLALTGDKPKHINIFISILSFWNFKWLQNLFHITYVIWSQNLHCPGKCILDRDLNKYDYGYWHSEEMWAKPDNRICALCEIKWKKKTHTQLFTTALWRRGWLIKRHVQEETF